MLYEAETPEDYLHKLDDDWRKPKLMELRALVLQHGPELQEELHYKMLGYGAKDRYAFHLNAQKGYVSLYVGNIARIDPDGGLLHGLNIGKSCVRFSKSKQISETGIEEFIKRQIEYWRAGADLDC